MGEQYPSPELSPDDAYLERVMEEAEANDTVITPTAARMIASQFHGGQASALYSLASCGAIDLERLHTEYFLMYGDPQTPEADKRKLDHLGIYFLEHGDRGPVSGWAQLWGGDG
jgi:hypothetical protein